MNSRSASLASRQAAVSRSACRVGLASALAAALALTFLLPGAGHHQDLDDRASAPAPIPVSVLIDAHRPGRAVPSRFLGLSFEVSVLAQIASYAGGGDFVNLLRSLGPGLLRFGGVSADTRVAWTDRLDPRPAWASATIGAGDLHRLGRLAALSGWRVLLTVGLAHYDPASAAREAAAAKAALGSSLAAIEIGNEPDAYARHHFRRLPWTYRQYDHEVRAYRRAIARLAPGLPIAGPGVSGSRSFAGWGPREARAQRPLLLTGHHYPLGCHQTPPPSIARLLSAGVHRLEGQSLGRYMSVSRASAIPFRIDEANSVSCGGRPGISNTFASALWASDYIAQAMTAGVSGINLQGAPANCGGYSPVCATSSGRLARGLLSAQPEWYALLLGKELLGGRPVHAALASTQPSNVLARAFLAPGGALRVLVVENDPPGGPPLAVSLHVGAGYRAATVLALTASSPAATGGVELGGRAVAGDGSWRAPTAPVPIAARAGAISITVPLSSAALITVLPAR
jgi:hypothetical protein